MDLSVSEELGRQPVTVLSIAGEVDYANYTQLTDRARQLYADGARKLIIDLSGVTYLGSSALVALHGVAVIFAGAEPPDPELGWAAIRAIGDAGTGELNVRLLAPSPQALRVLERTGLSDVFEIHADRASAIASLVGG